MVLHGKLAVHGCFAVHDRSFGRSPQKFVAVHLISPIGHSFKMGALFRIGRSFSPFSVRVRVVVRLIIFGRSPPKFVAVRRLS